MDLAHASVAQVLIPVEDLERATVFYRETLGLPYLFAAPPQMSFYQAGTVRLLVGVLEAGQPRRRGSAVYFGVKDIQEVHRTLASRGVEFLTAPHVVHRTSSSVLWLAEFTDPDGNSLVLLSETSEPSGSRGAEP